LAALASQLAHPGSWSTFGPHAIGTERFAAVSSGTSFAQVAGSIQGKQALVQNPDKDEFIQEAPWSVSLAKALPQGC
jgi:hypothetical protein